MSHVVPQLDTDCRHDRRHTELTGTDSEGFIGPKEVTCKDNNYCMQGNQRHRPKQDSNSSRQCQLPRRRMLREQTFHGAQGVQKRNFFTFQFAIFTDLQLLMWPGRYGSSGQMGDRVFGNPKNSVRVPFLGQDAAFPISAFKLAAAHGSPCAVLLSHKSGPASYELELVRIIRVKEGGVQKKNDGILEDAVREFSETLEAFCQRNPYQFFNFFDMWE